MQHIGIIIKEKLLADYLPSELPVNWEFDFCEQFPDPIAVNMKSLLANSLSTDPGEQVFAEFCRQNPKFRRKLKKQK